MDLVLWMMYIEDACSEVRSRFMCSDTKGTVNHPKGVEPRFRVVDCAHLLQ